MATYMYAITRPMSARGIDGVLGVAGAAVRVIDGDDLSCLVSTVDLDEFGEDALRHNLEDLDWLERVARQHDDVVRAGAQVNATVPLRLATICLDDDSARLRMRDFGDTARRALDSIDGHDEWGVKVFAQHPLSGVDSSEPAATTGRGYLQQRRQQLQVREQSAGQVLRVAEEVFETLAGLASDARRHRPHDRRLTGDERPMVLNAAFLVDRRCTAAFRSAVDAVSGADSDVSAVLTGPWPAYSFAPEPDA